MRSFIAYFVLIHVAFLGLGSCCKDVEIYQWNALKLVNLDNGGKAPVESDSAILAKAYGFRATLQADYMASVRKPISAAYAFSCDYAYQLDGIEAIEVRTLLDMGSETPAGSDISGRFVVTNTFSESSRLSYTIPALITYLNHHETENRIGVLDFLLMDYPDTAKQIRCILTIRTENDTVLTDTTHLVRLKY